MKKNDDRLRKKTILRITVVITILLLFAGINYTLNKVFYYPENPTAAITPLNVMTQLLAPKVQSVYAYNSFDTPHLFSHSKLSVSLSTTVSDNGPKYIEDKVDIDFLFGKATVSDPKALQFGDLTARQEEFLSNDIKHGAELFNQVNKDKYYVAKLSLLEPMKLDSFVEKYKSIMGVKIENNVGGNLYLGGVMWIPIKTSNDPQDVCVGAMGPYSGYYTAGNDKYKNLRLVDGTDYRTIELCFSDAINYMVDNIDEVNIYLKSGLFKNAQSVDFNKRIEFVKNNGYHCLGMVIYIKGDDLLSLKADHNLVLCTLPEQ